VAIWKTGTIWEQWQYRKAAVINGLTDPSIKW
jgi:hypothetical protein